MRVLSTSGSVLIASAMQPATIDSASDSRIMRSLSAMTNPACEKASLMHDLRPPRNTRLAAARACDSTWLHTAGIWGAVWGQGLQRSLQAGAQRHLDSRGPRRSPGCRQSRACWGVGCRSHRHPAALVAVLVPSVPSSAQSLKKMLPQPPWFGTFVTKRTLAPW